MARSSCLARALLVLVCVQVALAGGFPSFFKKDDCAGMCRASAGAAMRSATHACDPGFVLEHTMLGTPRCVRRTRSACPPSDIESVGTCCPPVSQCVPELVGGMCPYNYYNYDGGSGANCTAPTASSSGWSLFGRRRLQSASAAALYDKNGLPLGAAGVPESAEVRHDLPLPAPGGVAPLLSADEAERVPLAKMVPVAPEAGEVRRAAMLAARGSQAAPAEAEAEVEVEVDVEATATAAATAPAARQQQQQQQAAAGSGSGWRPQPQPPSQPLAQRPGVGVGEFIARLPALKGKPCKKLCCPACEPPPETVEVGRLLTVCDEGCALADAASGRCSCPGQVPPACPVGKLMCPAGPAAAAALCVDFKAALTACPAAEACAAKGPIPVC